MSKESFCVVLGEFGDNFGFKGALIHLFLFFFEEVLFYFEYLLLVGCSIEDARFIEFS